MQQENTPKHYDPISRFLHWGMALLFLIQLLSSMAHYFLEDSAIEAFLWSTHKPVGFSLMILVVFRIIWAIKNRRSRPSSVSKAAKLGHYALYSLMVIVPFIALLRQYGWGGKFEPFGIPVFAGFEGDKIEWMTNAGNLHGELGWTLMGLIVGHIIMVIVHRKSKTDVDVLPRMIPSKKAKSHQ